MSSHIGPSLRALGLLLLIGIGGQVSGQWHQYAYPDVFQAPSGVSTVLHVLNNDDLMAPASSINYLPNPIVADYPFPFGMLQSEMGGTLAILGGDSIEYTPPAGFTGNDRFYYGIADFGSPANIVDTAQVFLTVGTVTSVTAAVEPSLTLYPQPAGQVLRVASDQPVQSITVYSLGGRPLAAGQEQVDVSALPTGIYIARIQRNGNQHHLRFRKN